MRWGKSLSLSADDEERLFCVYCVIFKKKPKRKKKSDWKKIFQPALFFFFLLFFFSSFFLFEIHHHHHPPPVIFSINCNVSPSPSLSVRVCMYTLPYLPYLPYSPTSPTDLSLSKASQGKTKSTPDQKKRPSNSLKSFLQNNVYRLGRYTPLSLCYSLLFSLLYTFQAYKAINYIL